MEDNDYIFPSNLRIDPREIRLTGVGEDAAVGIHRTLDGDIPLGKSVSFSDELFIGKVNLSPFPVLPDGGIDIGTISKGPDLLDEVTRLKQELAAAKEEISILKLANVMKKAKESGRRDDLTVRSTENHAEGDLLAGDYSHPTLDPLNLDPLSMRPANAGLSHDSIANLSGERYPVRNDITTETIGRMLSHKKKGSAALNVSELKPESEILSMDPATITVGCVYIASDTGNVYIGCATASNPWGATLNRIPTENELKYPERGIEERPGYDGVRREKALNKLRGRQTVNLSAKEVSMLAEEANISFAEMAKLIKERNEMDEKLRIYEEEYKKKKELEGYFDTDVNYL